MDTNLLLKTFPTNENPGLSLVDPRFSEMGSLIQNGDYSEASALAESIISEDIFDIRIICYFLFGVFIEHGTNSFPQVIESIMLICTDNWKATLPSKNKEKQVINSFKWLFKQLIKKMEYEEKKQSSEWLGWQDETDSDTIEKSLDLCDELQQIITEKLGKSDSQLFDGISKIKSWLNSFYKLVYKEPEEVPEDESDSKPVNADEDEATEKSSSQPDIVKSDMRTTYEATEHSKNSHLAQLLKKIKTFEILINNKKFEQASLVAFDINDIVKNFDPKLYFPELFTRFSLLYAVNVKEIIDCEKHTKTAEWKSLQELYKVDIDGFTELVIDISFPETSMGNSQDFDAEEDMGYDE